MSRLFDTIGTAVSKIGQNEELTYQDIVDRQSVSKIAGITKIGALAIFVSSIALAIISLFTGFFGVLILGGFGSLAAIVARDVYKIASRVQNTVDNVVQDIPRNPLKHKYNQARYLTEGTWLIQSILLLFIDRTSSIDEQKARGLTREAKPL